MLPLHQLPPAISPHSFLDLPSLHLLDNGCIRRPPTDPATWKKRSPYFIKAGAPEAKKYPGFNPRQVEADGMIIEYDVAVPLRDGVKMYVDIYRPAQTSKVPCVIAWTPVVRRCSD
jgi:predicted acyl esterase